MRRGTRRASGAKWSPGGSHSAATRLKCLGSGTRSAHLDRWWQLYHISQTVLGGLTGQTADMALGVEHRLFISLASFLGGLPQGILSCELPPDHWLWDDQAGADSRIGFLSQTPQTQLRWDQKGQWVENNLMQHSGCRSRVLRWD